VKREVQPELLDSLPTADPGAIGSRRDLQKLHWWMGHCGLMERALRVVVNGDAPRRIIEVGAGDGEFSLRVARQLAPRWPALTFALVDQQQLVAPQTRSAFADLGWRLECVQADVFDWFEVAGTRSAASVNCGENIRDAVEHVPTTRGRASTPDPHSADVILANLFLHHFEDNRLADLFNGIARAASTFIALEPRRSRLALTFSQQIWAIGCNHVSRHDAPVSVRAGFAGEELSRLWPTASNWSLEERPAGLFSHLFIAQWRQ
jgi:hypothetical protein